MGLRRFTLLVASMALASAAFSQGRSFASITAQKSTSALEQLRLDVPEVQVYRQGTRVSRVYGVPFGYGYSPEQAAIAFVNEYADIFEPGQGALQYSRSQDVMDGKFTAVYFDQFVNGIQVYKGHLTVLVRNEVGSPIVLASSSVETVDLKRSMRQIPASRAEAVVLKAKPGLSVENPSAMVAWNGEEATVLAWAVRVGNTDLADPKRFTAFVDASNGQVLEWRDEVHFVDVNGNIQAWSTPGLRPNQPNNPATLGNLVDVTARIVAGNSTKTNSLGNFTIPNPGAGAVTVQTELLGTWANVNNQAAADEVLSLGVTPPGPANFIYNTAKTEFVQAQVDGFIHTQGVHNFAKAINGAYPGIDIPIPVAVNIASSCNAYYTNSTINFYRSGGGCPNMSYTTVVYHEYGHFIIDMGHPSPTGDYHEGIADVTAAFGFNDPCLGRDFFGQDTGCLRNTYNGVLHPCSGGSHDCGQVISGAFWLTKDELDVTMGAGPALTYSRELYLNSILLHPNDINPGVTIDVLTLDDDDGNIFNGTPHYTEIAEGFGAKNLDAPELVWLNFTPVSIPGEFVQLPHGQFIYLTFNITNNVGVLNPSSPRLTFRFNGGVWNERIMTRLNPTSPWQSYIETPPAGTVIEWFVKATDTQNHLVIYPAGAPNVTLVGNSLTTTLNDTFESALGWTVVNDASLSTGGWVRANPNGTFLNGQPANPENDSSDAGFQCAFTGQAAVGGGAGDQDVDGGPTSYISPVFDLSGGNGVVDLNYWFYNDDGDDSMIFELSNNGGTTWTTVKTTMFTGAENTWTNHMIIVSNYLPRTNNMRVRVRTSDNPNNSVTEAAIDAFRVRRLQ